MGTSLSIEVVAGSREDGLLASEDAYRALDAVERRLSTWRSDSELSTLNAAPVGARVEVSAELAADLRFASEWAHATGGAFDPCVGAHVFLWDLRGAGRWPSDEEVERALIPGGFASAIRIEGRSVVRLDARLRLEEGAFGKGLGLDAALDRLRARGARSAVLDLGGQVAVLNDDSPVRWSIADPGQRDRPVIAWEFHGGSLATSGDSERSKTVDGRRIGHILDPRTGRPARDFGSVTVHASSAADADALSTALFVLQPEAGIEWLRAHEGFEAVFLEFDGEGLRARASEKLRGRVSPLIDGLEVEFFSAASANTR